jgi:hypothetical protein
MPIPPQTRSGKPGPGLGVSIGLMVVGTMIAIASVIAIAIPLVNIFSSREYAVPVPQPISIHLEHARYTVFERTSSGSGFSLGGSSGRVTIDPSQVTVTAPDGTAVYVFPAVKDETVHRGSTEYKGAVQFDAPMVGDYRVRLSTRIVTSVIIVRSVEDTIRSVLVWFGTGAVGGVLLIAGLVMLIVGITRRGRARRASQFGWGQPAWGQPGWGQPQWGAPQYPPAPYGPPPQYPPPQYPPPAAPDPPDDPWAPPPQAKS